MKDQFSNPQSQLRSVAERLNVFQDVEAREENFERLSRDLTNNLFILLRSAGLYDLDNSALDQPYDLLLKSISGLFEMLRSRIAIRLNDGNFFVNRRLVKLDFSTFQNARYLIKIFNFLGINELSIDPKISRADLKVFLQTFVHTVREKKNNFKDISLPNMEARKLKIGEIHPLLKAQSDNEKIAAWYGTACFVTQNFYQDTKEGRVPQHSLLKRTVLTLIEFPKRVCPLLARLDLLASDKEQGGILFVHSVEAAGLTNFIATALDLDADSKLALTTAALQLFQGWSLLEDKGVKYFDPQSTKQVFAHLESSREELTAARNEIIRTLLDLGGVSESVIQRIMITYEAQRGLHSQWETQIVAHAKTRPSRAQTVRLYKGGLGRSFLTDIVYGAHLFCHLRRQVDPKELWSKFNQAALSPEIQRIFYQLLGRYPFGSPVRLNNGDLALITACNGDQVEGIALIKHGHDPLRVKVEKQIEVRTTSPIQVLDFLSNNERNALPLASQRALLFSHLNTPNQSENS